MSGDPTYDFFASGGQIPAATAPAVAPSGASPGGGSDPTYEWFASGGSSVSAPENPALGSGTLYVGPWNTHVPIPQGVNQALAGAGMGIENVGRGIGQALGLESRSDIAAARAQDAPLAATIPGKIGNIAGTVASYAPLALVPGAQTIGGATLLGAATGALSPSTSTHETLENTGFGALAGGVGGALGRALKPAAASVLPRAQAADVLDAEGIPLSVAQRTGSKLAQHLERASAMTSDKAAEFAGEQQQAFNQAVLKRIGADPTASSASPEVLSDAKAKIVGTMDDIAGRTKIQFDPQLESDISEVEQRISRTLPSSSASPLTRNIDDIVENAAANDGVLDGTFYQKLRSNLSALRSNPDTAPLAGDLQSAVDEAFQRSASPEDASALAGARQQYRALKQIEPAINPATGDVSPLALMRSMALKSNRNQALYGKGDQSLMTLARAAKQVLPDALGNSGTAERLVYPLGVVESLASGAPISASAKLMGAKLALGGMGKALRGQGAQGAIMKGLTAGWSAAAPVRAVAARAALPATLGTEQQFKPLSSLAQ